MPALLPALLLLIGLFAQSPAVGDNDTSELRFGWPECCRAIVTETAEKDGHRVVSRYLLTMTPRPEGARVVRISEREVIGVDDRGPGSRIVLETNLRAGRMVEPLLRIAPDGSLAGIPNIEAVVASGLRAADGLIEEPEQVGAILRDPRMRKLWADLLGESWESWVGSWIGLSLAPGEGVTKTVATTLGGTEVEVRVSFRHEAPDPERPGHVILSGTTIYEGEAIRAILDSIIASLPEADRPATLDAALLRKTVTIRGSVDPRDLRPRWSEVRHELGPNAEGAGDPTLVKRERHEFEWLDAPGIVETIRREEAEAIAAEARRSVANDPEGALAACEESIALFPAASAHLLASAALRSLDRLDEAWAACERATAIESGLVTGIERARVRLARGEYAAIAGEIGPHARWESDRDAVRLHTLGAIATGRISDARTKSLRAPYWEGVLRALHGDPWGAADRFLAGDPPYAHFAIAAVTGETALLRELAGTEWPARIAAFLRGELPAADLLAESLGAETDRERRERACEAHFYIAFAALRERGFAAARPHLEACVATRVFTFDEAIWASGLLATGGEPVDARASSGGRTVRRSGYIDRSGDWVVPPVLDHAGRTTAHGSRVECEQVSGLLLPTGRVRRFDPAHDYWGEIDDSGWVKARTSGILGERSGFVDASGEFVIPARFANLDLFDAEVGLAWAVTPAAVFGGGERAGYIDRTGNWAFDREIERPGRFREGWAFVRTAAGENGYIDATGAMVLPLPGLEAGPFSEGLAVYSEEGAATFGYLDREGNRVIPPRFDDASSFEDGRAVVEIEERIGIIDREGKWVLEPADFEFIRSLGEGRWSFGVDGRVGLLDRDGHVIREPGFESIDRFSEGLAAAELDDLHGCIDPSGSWVIPPRFRALAPFSRGRAAAEVELPVADAPAPAADLFEDPALAAAVIAERERARRWAALEASLVTLWTRARVGTPIDPEVREPITADSASAAISSLRAELVAEGWRGFLDRWLDPADFGEVVAEIEKAPYAALIEDPERTEAWLRSELARRARLGFRTLDEDQCLAQCAAELDPALGERCRERAASMLLAKLGPPEVAVRKLDILLGALEEGTAEIESTGARDRPGASVGKRGRPGGRITLTHADGTWRILDWD